LALGQGFTIEQVLSPPFLSELVAAGRGQRVAGRPAGWRARAGTARTTWPVRCPTWQAPTSPAEGGKPILLTPGACEFEDATLTADSRGIIYSSNCGDIDRRHLWRAHVAGGKPESVTRSESIEWSPAITGDGAYLVFLGSDAR